MANRKITELTALTAPAVDDILPIIDISEGADVNKNKKITYAELLASAPDGTVGAPGFSFNSATSTGLYKSAANEISIATNGGRAIQIEANNKTTIYGDLVVTGGTTTVSSTTITVADKNLELATGNSSDAGCDGGGLTLKGASDKEWKWIDSSDSWTSNQNIDITTGKVYKVAGSTVLTETTLGSGVVGSSLTSVGTLGTLAVTNTITAGSLDISGGADIDGTMEADAYTVDGTALNEYIADTVGGMVSSNTETNITVTYEDSDNTLDFVIGTLNQDTTGNAATATALQTARTIGGVSFNGTANISLPGVNQTGNQNTTGSAATLTTARTIGGVSFDGSANINLPGVNAAGNQNTSGTAAGLSGTPNITVGVVTAGSLDISGGADIDGTLEADAYTVAGTALNEYIADTVGAMVSSNTETNITVTYDDADNTLDFVIGTLNQNTTGNAATATALQTARTIGGVSFDGTGNITLPGVNATGNQNTTGSAATLTTARTIGGVSFNGSANIDLPGVNAAGNQNTTGNAATATVLQTARTIGGVSFNGSANIDLPGVNAAGNQNTTGNAATATALATARTIGGTSFDGTANITPANATNAVNLSGTLASGVTGTTQSTSDNSTKIATTAYVTSAVANLIDSAPGALDTLNELAAAIGDDANFSTTITNSLATKLPLAGGTMTGAINLGSNNITNGGTITGTFAGNITGNVTGNTSGSSGSCTGNAATATALQNARTINGVSFDGTGNITVTSAAGTLTGSTLASGVTASSLTSVGTLAGLTTSSDVVIQNQKDIRFSEASGNGTNYVALQAPAAISSNYTLTLPAADGSSGQHLKTDGSGNLSWETPVSAASDLTGSTLASGVTASSLTSVGTLTGLTTSGNILMTGTGCIDIAVGTTAQRPGSPTSGMFRFNSTLSKFEGHDGSAWGEIGGGGGGASFYINTLSSSSNTGGGSATFNGTAYRFQISNAPATGNAAQMLVSVGGVIQKANSGTSQPSEGYAISGNDIIFGAAPASAASWFIITYGALNAGEPTDNTVDEAKLKVSNSPTNGYFLSAQSGNTGGLTWAAVDLSSKLSLTGGTLTGQVNFDNGSNAGRDIQWQPSNDRLAFFDNTKATFGDGVDLQISHNGSQSIIDDVGSGALVIRSNNAVDIKDSDNVMMAAFNKDADVKLYHNGGVKLETLTNGVRVTGQVDVNGGGISLEDSRQLLLGTDDDAYIMHNGSHQYNRCSTGYYHIQAQEIRFNKADGNETLLKAISNGAVELYYDNSKKFETYSSGTKNTGHFIPTATETYDLGDNSLQWRHLYVSDAVNIKDNGKAIFGAGDDLQIFHDGTNSVLRNTGGTLYLQSQSHIELTHRHSDNSEEKALFSNVNGAVELYHNGTKKFETTADGAKISGTSDGVFNLDTSDSRGAFIRFGQGGSYHNMIGCADGLTSGDKEDLGIRAADNIFFAAGGSTERMRITSAGNVSIANDSGKFTAGASDDLQIYHDSANNYWNANNGHTYILANGNDIYLRGVNNEDGLIVKSNGAVELYYDNSKKFATYSGGVEVFGDCSLGDNRVLNVGTGSDLQIYHNGTDSYINSRTGNLYLAPTTGVENGITIVPNAEVRLYYDNSKKFETTSNGIEISGIAKLKAGNQLELDNGFNNKAAKIQNAEGSGTSDLRFFTGSTPAENFRITASGNVWLPNDNGKLMCGAGTDLLIYHDGTHNRIDAVNGNLYLRVNSTENALKATPNGSVEICYNGTKQFQTIDGGFNLQDNFKAEFGGSGDLKIYHDGSHSRIVDSGTGGVLLQSSNPHIMNAAGNESIIHASENGSVELYYDGTKQLETYSSGIQCVNDLKLYDSKVIRLGSLSPYGDLKLYHNGTNSYIDNVTGILHLRINDTENAVVAVPNAEVALYYNGSKHFETNSTGAYVTSRLGVASSVSVGTSSLQSASVASFKGSTYNQVNIAHSGNSSWGLLLTNSANSSSNYHRSTNSGAACAIVVVANESLHLATDNQARWSVHHTGHFLPDSNNTYDIGNSTYRVRNLYINDLQLSNKGSQNDVDGTWGDWTLQEGEEDLFMINNRSGKKYKMALQEVS